MRSNWSGFALNDLVLQSSDQGQLSDWPAMHCQCQANQSDKEAKSDDLNIRLIIFTSIYYAIFVFTAQN